MAKNVYGIEEYLVPPTMGNMEKGEHPDDNGMVDIYNMMDIHALPTGGEGFGIPTVEAMACGTPVAAYPVQGPIDVIDNDITGVMDANLSTAIKKALDLDRENVYNKSTNWSWERAWEIFRDNLRNSK